MPTRYLVCGGRDFADKGLMNKALTSLIRHPADAVIIHGGASGADTMAMQWGIDHGAQVLGFVANWDQFKNAAGPIRNRQMLDEGKPDVVLAFKGGPGTKNMVKQARARPGLVVITIYGTEGDWYGEPA